MRLLSFLAAAALALGWAQPALSQQATAPVKPPPVGLLLVDLTQHFDIVWTEAQALPEARRAAYFQDKFSHILPGFYDYKRMERYGVTAEKYREHLTTKLSEYPAQRDGIARVSREFSGAFEPAKASFERAFGPLTGYPPVYLVHSLGEFDGGTRELPEGGRLMFGADMIDKLYKTTPIRPFFHHELFHLYHGRRFPDCEPIWCSLWTEGLAVYVAAQLNPGTTDAALLLEFPVPLREAVEKDRAGAICSVMAKLESTKSDDYTPLFQGRPQPGAKYPPRYGYYIGYLVAQDLGRSRSLRQLAEMTPEEVKPLLVQSLGGMGSCAGERG